MKAAQFAGDAAEHTQAQVIAAQHQADVAVAGQFVDDDGHALDGTASGAVRRRACRRRGRAVLHRRSPRGGL